MHSLRARRGQNSAGPAASLIALIALLIIVYVILLPPDIRKEILDNDTNGNGNGNGNADDLARTLVSDDIGTLDKLGQDEFEHHLSAVTIYTVESASVLFEVESVYVKYGLFDKQFQEIEFSIDDVDAVSDVMLSMHAAKKSGALTVKLNGKTLLSGEIPEYPAPIKIDKKTLEADNVLSFEVSDVGFRFWHTNEYVLEDLKITADVKDASQQSSSTSFTVTREEKDNLESVELRYFPDCRLTDVGSLEISLNNQRVFNSIPDCGSVNIADVSPGLINEGTNRIVFSASKGYYLIDQIKVNTQLAEITYPIYYFELDQDDINEIEDDNLEVNMSFKFVDDVDLKSATIYINGRRISINTRDSFYSRLITSYVEEGTNAVKIEPESNQLDVIVFKVILQEVDN